MAADAVAEAGDILDKLKIDEKKEETMSDSKGDASSQKKGKSAGRRFFRSFRLVRRPYEERLKEFEEEQKKKEVLETNCRGTVKWYSVRGKYGFISREDGKGDDVFCHQSGISMSQTEKFYLRSLAPDQVVEFDLVKGSKGIEAANIRGPDGTAVQDAKDGRSFFRFPFFRRDKKSSGKKDGDSKSKDDEKSDNKEVDKSASKKTGGLRSKFNRRNKEKKTDGEEPPKEEPTSSNKTEDVTEPVQNDAEANKQ